MTLTSLPPAGGIHRGVQYFNECLRASKHFSNLTEELERTGDVTNFHFKLPQVHDVEKRCKFVCSSWFAIVCIMYVGIWIACCKSVF